MTIRAIAGALILSVTLAAVPLGAADEITVEGAPTASSFSAGSEASFRAKLTTDSGIDLQRFLVFADVSYVGTTAVSSAQLDLQMVEAIGRAGAATFEGGWFIPHEAPTGVYSVTLRVEDRGERRVFTRKKIRGFAVYKKPIRIARTTLDGTHYLAGQPIQCEVALQNLSGQQVKGLRVEFSNAYYPWIAEAGATTSDSRNPALGIKVLREQLNVPPQSEVTLRMTPAGTANLLRYQSAVRLGAAEPVTTERPPRPEVNRYAVAVWNADRTVLHDFQFTAPAIVRPLGSTRPVPYGPQFTHTYNSEIDVTKYREFYQPGHLSPVIALDHARTMFRPGDTVPLKATVKIAEGGSGNNIGLIAEFVDPQGKPSHAARLRSWPVFEGETTYEVNCEAWNLPADLVPGTYAFKLALSSGEGQTLATTASEIAVNPLPASLMVFSAHPDDEVAYAGLIRAAVEAGIPVRVVIFTGGELGACERYVAQPCGPNEAREFGMVRMEESADALAHLGVPRENLTFLGLPDGGLGAIWSEHRQAANPFRSFSLATDHAPYENVFKPNLPFARDSVIEVTKQLIAEFRPATIALAHPDERHADHRAASWIAIKACQDLLREKQIDPNTMVLADVSYGAGGYKPAPYKYEKVVIHLSGEAAARKQEMEWFYQSQHGNRAEAARRNYAELPRREEHLRILDWQEHAGWNE